MRVLLDTNVVSELIRPRPDAAVEAWTASCDPSDTFISVATVAELAKGIQRLPSGPRRTKLAIWFDAQIRGAYATRTIAVDLAVAERWGTLLAERELAGKAISAMDGLLAATALVHRLVIATRNTAHFTGTGVDLINPWNA